MGQAVCRRLRRQRQQRRHRDDTDVGESRYIERATEPGARGVLARDHAQADAGLESGAWRRRRRSRQAVEGGRRRLFGSHLEHHIEQPGRAPLPVHLDGVGGRLVGAERDLEAQQAADDDDQILESAMALLADRSLTVIDQRARGRNVGHALDQEPAEAFARGIEPWRVVEAADEQEEFVEGDAH